MIYRLAVEHPQLFRLGRALVNARTPARLGAVTGRMPMEKLRCNQRNMETEHLRIFYRDCIEDVPAALAEQLMTVARTGYLMSADGKFNYTAELGRVSVPVLCIAGKLDNMCEPAGVRFAYEHLGSSDKTYLELAQVNGFKADYGHVDMLMGRKVHKEVFPRIRDWLRKHDGT